MKAHNGQVEGIQVGWLRPTTTDATVQEMRGCPKEDNYMYGQGALHREEVSKMLEQYLQLLERTALLGPDEPSGLGMSGGDPDGEEFKRLPGAHVTAPYPDIFNHPELRKLVRERTGQDEEFLLRRTMLRQNVLGGESTGVQRYTPPCLTFKPWKTLRRTPNPQKNASVGVELRTINL